MRQGEILALTYVDIDSEKNIIHVNKSIKFLTVNGEYKPIINTPKTVNGNKNVPILDNIKQLLLKHIKNEKEKHLKLGIPFKDTNVIFSSASFKYKVSANVTLSLKRLLKRLDINETNFHALRHMLISRWTKKILSHIYTKARKIK